MKCIQAVKATKHYELDEIRRVNDVEAEEKVSSGYWKFIPKSDWKSLLRKQLKLEEPKVTEPVKTISDSVIKGHQNETISEKQLKRKKNK
jgi:hypothetical protein